MAATVERFGRLDIIVNCVGGGAGKVLFDAQEYPRDAWDWIMELNVRSTLLATQAAVREMIERGNGGAVVNISSVRADLGINAGYSAYVAAKGAISALTRQWATEWAKHGIRVNAIRPTFVDTPQVAMLLGDPNFKAGIVSRIPLGRVGDTDDMTGPGGVPRLGRRSVHHRPGSRRRRRPHRDPVAPTEGSPTPMEQVTSRIFAETKVRGCNPSFVLTSKGPVVIDTPQLPSKAVEMRKAVEEHGTIQYVINTEHHVDHIFGNYWFKGAGPIIHHQGVHERFMTVYPELDPFAYALEALPTDDPDGAALVPDRETYYANMGTADIVFTGDVTLKVGDHTFHLLHTPGHTPGQVAVYVPEERAVFTGDTVFSECTTWLMTSDVDQWISSLDRIRALDVDHVIPGHGPVQDKDYLATQRSFMLEWKAAVRSPWPRAGAARRPSPGSPSRSGTRSTSARNT